jgi:hypothetical protein
MSAEMPNLTLAAIRGSDSNSLLRLYDTAKAICSMTPSLQQRARADKVMQRLAKELKKRNVALGTGPQTAVPAI